MILLTIFAFFILMVLARKLSVFGEGCDWH